MPDTPIPAVPVPSPTARYYPRLSEVITIDDLPEFLSFVQDGFNNIFDKIHYKNLQYSKSYRGDSAFYSLDIVSSKKLALKLPFDLALVLNPDLTGGDSNISSFPITLEYQWEILAFLKTFSSSSFSFSLEDFYKIGLDVFRISEEQVIAHMLNLFVEPAGNSTEFEQMLTDINEIYAFTGTDQYKALSMPAGVTQSITTLSETINKNPHIAKTVPLVLFGVYILKNDINDTKAKLQEFYNTIAPDGIEAHIKRIITPKAKATLALSAAIEFPNNILKPVKLDGTVFDPTKPNLKTSFVFAQAQMYVDTEAGFGYQVELGGSLYPSTFAAIGNTGLLLEIDSLKLDLSKKTNIPEADADGRPNDFVGVYARAISVTLPSKWFHDDTEPATNTAATLRIGAYDLLVGSGGLSGTILLQTVPVTTSSQFNYFNDKFNFNYPITMFEKNEEDEVVEKILANYDDLITYLSFLNTTRAQYVFKFPLTLTTIAPVKVYTFNSAPDYQLFLATLIENVLWKKIGGDKGFRVGFNKFDITFKQNKVISSNIEAALEIKKFVYPANTIVNGVDVGGQQVKINVQGHLYDDGDFNLTASVNPGFPIELANILKYDIRTLELGKEDDDFYIGTSGTLSFPGVAVLDKIKAIDINRLRIYSNGSIEIQGGSIMLVEPIIIPLGPVNITVTAIHYGSHQKEVNGVMRKFNYFGFDGGLKVDPLGVEIRGDGIKYYYCVDDLPNKPKAYLHIQTLYLDLTIPANSPTIIIKGWLTIPEPGTSPEYAGGIDIKLPKLKIAGGASMKLMPKYPAFIIDANIDLPAPIPIGTFAIYGFRGLIGYRYVAEKEAIGLVSGKNTWYEYYKAPQRGINVRKFNGPNRTKKTGTPVSLGFGASLGTSFDNGLVLNLKAMMLLSLPSLFMIDGRLSVISARLGLDEGGEPPFFAFVAIGDDSLELGFGADFKLPSSSGEILTLNANVEAYFNFKGNANWYVHFGTRERPITSKVLSLLNLSSYLMLSSSGIEAGARGDFSFKKKYGPVKVSAWAYVEVGGKISFERPQFGAYIAAGVGADINIKILRVYISIDVLFGAEAVKPMRIYGAFRVCVRVKIFFVKIKFCGNVELIWDIRKTIDTSPINPLINQSNIANISDIVKGVNMLTNETFELTYLTSVPTTLPASIQQTIIPLDTYIDIKSEKGLLPAAVASIIGGVNNPPAGYVDLVPPVSSMRGKKVTQVKHQYAIESITLKAWSGSAWIDYHPYKALYPADSTGVFNNLKIGQWQKSDNQYNTIRLLATNPFSYTEQGEPGWFTPEQYGITAGSLFCQGIDRDSQIANFLKKPLNHRYYCYDTNNHFFYSNNVAFVLLNSADDEFGLVSNQMNPYNFKKSLSFKDTNILQAVLPEPAIKVTLKLTSFKQKVKIKYYAVEFSEAQYEPLYINPNPEEGGEYHEVIEDVTSLKNPIIYDHPDWKPVAKIVIEPMDARLVNNQLDNLEELLALAENNNLMVVLDGEGEMQTTQTIEEQIAALGCEACIPKPKEAPFFINRYIEGLPYSYYDSVISGNYIYYIGDYKYNDKFYGLITKVDKNGNLIWQKKYLYNYGYGFSFRNVLACNNGDLLLSVVQKNIGTYLVYRVSSEGTVLWKKQFNPAAAIGYGAHFYGFNHLENDNYILAFSVPTYKSINPPVVEITLHIIKIDGNGVVLSKKKTTGFNVEKVICTNNKVIVIGNKIANTNVIVLVLDKDLVLLNKFNLQLDVPLEYVTFKDAVVKNEQLLLTGIITKNIANDFYEIFICSIDISTNTPKSGIQNLKIIGKTKHLLVSDRYAFINANVNSIYVKFTTDYLGFGLSQLIEVVVKLNYNLDIIWTKTFDGVLLTLDQITEQQIVFTWNENYTNRNTDIFGIIRGISHAGSSNLDFETSKTATIANYPSQNRVANFTTVDYQMANSDFQDATIAIASEPEVTDVPVTKIAIRVKPTCEVFTEIKTIYDQRFYITNTTNYSTYATYANQILTILNENNDLKTNPTIQSNYNIVTAFYNNPSATGLINTIDAIQIILDTLDGLGNCTCICEEEDLDNGAGTNSANQILFHQVEWLSLEDYEYNLNIPQQAAIAADALATRAAVSELIQPIWRPDTSYYVNFKLRDIVNDTMPTVYDFTYGFSTAGPVGFFHKNQYAKYVQAGQNVDQYPLTSLRQYIDYQRSYPNADGNLLSAKPLFYDDDNNTKIDLYFTKAYVTHFFQDWEAYPALGLPAIKAKMKIIIKDPREDISIVNPPSLDTITESIDIPQTTQLWAEDEDPIIPFVFRQWASMLENNTCVLTEGDKIVPKSKYLSVTLKKLKPLKLYTAIVNGMYDLHKDGKLGPIPNPNNSAELIHQEETTEIHKFIFQTSRYKNFREQVESYKLTDAEGTVKEVVFEIEKAFTPAEINALYATIKGTSLATILPEELVSSLNVNYQHAFDRAVEGILGLSPLNIPISTEFNVIKDSNTDKAIAVLIKNPEPFNNPKIPLEFLKDTIQVITGSLNVDSTYRVLHSKDLSQVIIMHDSLALVPKNMNYRFQYKIWNGSRYIINTADSNSVVIIAQNLS
jgi:hypothetical protein